MLNHTFIKRSLATGLVLAAAGLPATAQAAFMDSAGSAPSAPAVTSVLPTPQTASILRGAAKPAQAAGSPTGGFFVAERP